MSAKILVAAVQLMVTRDAMTILPVAVPSHEVGIVQALHGEENVLVDEANKPEPVALEAAGEPERLLAKYGQGALEAAFGQNFRGAIARAVKDATVGTASTEEGGEDLMALSKDKLLALATERGAKADASMNKAAIVAAIQAAAA